MDEDKEEIMNASVKTLLLGLVMVAAPVLAFAQTATTEKMSEMTPLTGGVPIMIDGQIVGAVGVSGAANAQQDEELAKSAAAAIR